MKMDQALQRWLDQDHVVLERWQAQSWPARSGARGPCRASGWRARGPCRHVVGPRGSSGGSHAYNSLRPATQPKKKYFWEFQQILTHYPTLLILIFTATVWTPGLEYDVDCGAL